MANAKEIQTRMKSIQDTMKITNAMYMISSSKMQKAKKILQDTEPYFYNMQAAIARILRHMPDIQHPFFSERHLVPKDERKVGTIVITGDKGMAGAYNHNVQKMTEDFMEEVPGHHKLYVLGMVGRQYFGKRDVDMDGSFQYTVQKPTMHRARLITEEIVRAFLERELDEIHIVYTQMQNAVVMEPVNMQLLPLKKTSFSPLEMPAEVHQEEIEMFLLSVIQTNIGKHYAVSLNNHFFERDGRKMLRIYFQIINFRDNCYHDIWAGIPTD